MGPSVWCVVVAAGAGSRFGLLKQYEDLGGRRVVDWSVAAARAIAGRPGIDGVVLVVPAERAGEPEPTADVVVAGGATRSESVRCGLAAVPPTAEIVVVHDAARPLAGAALFEAVVSAVAPGVDAAIPGIPVADTIKQVAGDVVTATVDRAELVVVQTPQAFRADALRRAHADGGEATDDAALVEAQGGSVVVVPGDPRNVKITTPTDLAVARLHLA